jgi:integrase/recombinase XerD
MRLSALFEEFSHFLRVEKEAAPRTIETYRWCFRDYESFVMKQIGGTVLVSHFTAETCRAYQYDLAARGLQTSSIRVRLATLGSLGKWAVRRDKIARNPVDVLTRPRRKARLPRVPRWETVESVLEHCTDVRDKALVALMCFGALRRSEIVALDVGDVAPGLGLRRVQGKGGVETAVPLPKVAQDIVAGYIATVRGNAKATDPLFVSCFKTKGGHVTEVRMKGHRVWKITKTIGERAGVPEIHPHAFRHSSGVELLRLSGGNLRAVQEHLRHADIQTTTVYTRLTQSDLQKVISEFDKNNGGENRNSYPSPHGT